MRSTTPSVSAPVRWFCFSTICTRRPARIWLRLGSAIRGFWPGGDSGFFSATAFLGSGRRGLGRLPVEEAWVSPRRWLLSGGALEHVQEFGPGRRAFGFQAQRHLSVFPLSRHRRINRVSGEGALDHWRGFNRPQVQETRKKKGVEGGVLFTKLLQLTSDEDGTLRAAVWVLLTDFGQPVTRRHVRPQAVLRVGEVVRQHGDSGRADQAVDPGEFFAHPIVAIIF